MRSHTRQLVLAALFAALTALGAFLKIPLPISSLTLQFLFTAMSGVLLGPVWGATSQGVYLLLGLMGLPIFTLGGGLGYVLQPTFGFLLGLIPAAWVIGKLAEGRTGLLSLFGAAAAGLGILYLVGLPYMYFILNVYLDKGMTVWAVVRAGMLLFLPGDVLKLLVTAWTAAPLRRALSQHG